MLRQVQRQRLSGHRFGDAPDFGVAQLVLGLTLELRVARLDADGRGDALPGVLPGQVGSVGLEQLVLAGVIVDRPGQGGAKAGEVGAAVRRLDAVGVGMNRLGEGFVVLEGHLHGGAVHRLLAVKGRFLDGVQPPVVAGHHGRQAAVEQIGAFDVAAPVPGVPRALEIDGQPLVQIGGVLEMTGQGVEFVLNLAEDGVVGGEDHRGAVPLGAGLPDQGREGPALGVFLGVQIAVPADFGPEVGGKGVDHRGAHPVEAAGNLVGAAAELAAGVERGHHRLQCADIGGRMWIHGDAPAVVGHRNPPVGGDLHVHGVAMPGHGLVHRVVQYFDDHVLQPGQAGAADVHPRPHPHRLQPLQHGDVGGVVGVPRFGIRRRGIGGPLGGGPGFRGRRGGRRFGRRVRSGRRFRGRQLHRLLGRLLDHRCFPPAGRAWGTGEEVPGNGRYLREAAWLRASRINRFMHWGQVTSSGVLVLLTAGRGRILLQ